MADNAQQSKDQVVALAPRRAAMADALEVDYGDPEIIKVLKAEICPPGTTDNEFKVFIARCRQSGLNPFLGECFCVERWSNVYNGQTQEWTPQKRNVFQAAEAGMASRAERFDDYGGIRFGVVYAKDICEIDDSTGDVKHRYNLTADRGAIVAAWAQVIRKGYFFSPDVVLLKDFVQVKKRGKDAGQPTEMWKKPDVMLPKCARAAAYRRAYPRNFAGVYAREEQEDDETPAETLKQVKVVSVGAPPPPPRSSPPPALTQQTAIEEPPEPEEPDFDTIVGGQQQETTKAKSAEMSEQEKFSITINEATARDQLNNMVERIKTWPDATERDALKAAWKQRFNELDPKKKGAS